MPRRISECWLGWFWLATCWPVAIHAQAPAEPALAELPAGVIVQSSTRVPEDEAQAIGRRLGGQVARLTNSVVRIHGRPIQVNVVTAADEASAARIHATLSRHKPAPFCFRRGLVIVEYVGNSLDAGFARKVSIELGWSPRPDQVIYRVAAELAAVDKADYPACQPLFQALLNLEAEPTAEARDEVARLARSFQFGRRVTLRDPTLSEPAAEYRFRPEPEQRFGNGGAVTWTFGELPRREGIPLIGLEMEIPVTEGGFRAAGRPADTLTESNSFWPADRPQLVELASTITAGQTSSAGKAKAILEWLTPGRNLRYQGETGSRWGTGRVLEQRFGHCWDFSDCFVTLARAAGLPSRQVAGWLYGSSGHVWAEYYDGERGGWQQVDPTGGGELACGIWHIPWFTSETGELPILYLRLPRIEMLDSAEGG